MDWGRQGGLILGYIIAFLGYYGTIANTIMYEQYYSRWISFVDIDKRIFFWTYTIYIQAYLLPILVLFLVSFLLTYKEDVPQYGIKASLGLVPLIVIQGFFFYILLFGFSIEIFVLQFARIEGYLNVLILYGIVIAGSVSGMKVKQHLIKKRELN